MTIHITVCNCLLKRHISDCIHLICCFYNGVSDVNDLNSEAIILQNRMCYGRQTQIKYSTKTYTILRKKLQIFTRQITHRKIKITTQYNPYILINTF